MQKLLFSLILQILVLSIFPIFAFLQECRPPEIVFNKDAYNIFNDEQEMYLGEVIAEQAEREYRIIEDEKVNGLVRRIGSKLIKHLPPSRLNFKFHVVDLPEINAFASVGGHIYITRKMIAFVRSEDELAGIIAHELGHSTVHHSAVDISQNFKKILKVEEVGDKADIFEKYNRFLENWRTKRIRSDPEHQSDQQLEADKIGVFAMTAAGYDPNAFTTAFDRLAETEGKTGNWLSNFLGTTRPAEKRLGEMIRAVKNLPASCLDSKTSVSPKEFKDWQTLVISYSNYAEKEKVSAVIRRKLLTPKLRDDINHLEFSPDGKYILAQDDSTIFVVEKEPFRVLFRIESPEAQKARFSPDSKAVVFDTSTMRVERWSIAQQKPEFVREVFLREDCMQTALSDDGRMFVCFSLTFGSPQISLKMIDVQTNEVILEKDRFYQLKFIQLVQLLVKAGLEYEKHVFQTGFSPDGRYFVASRVLSVGIGGVLGYDLLNKKEIKIGSGLRRIISSPFAFYSNNKIIGQNSDDGKNSGIFDFPSGHRLEKFTLQADSLTKVNKGNYVLVRPLKVAPVGIFDVRQKKFVVANKTPAVDAYENSFVSENKTGVLGLFRLDRNETLAELEMPESRFGEVRSITVSPDLFWVAVSDKSRGAVWSLYSGDRYFYTQGFRGAFFDKDGKIYADFIKTDQVNRQVAVLDVRSKEIETLRNLDAPNTRQHGQFLVSVTSEKGKENKGKRRKRPDYMIEYPDDYDVRENGLMEVRDVRTGEMLWSRKFDDEIPQRFFDSLNTTITFLWNLKSKAAKEIVKTDEALRKRASDMGDKDGDYLAQVVEAETGKVIGHALIETGERSFRLRQVFAAGPWLTVIDSENRVLFYFLKDGGIKHRFFGSNATVSSTGKLAAVENNYGQLSIYDLETSEKLEQLNFKMPIIFAQFDKYGRKLLVLTADQESFTLDATKFIKPEKVAESN